MTEQKRRLQRINANLKLQKIPASSFKNKIDASTLGLVISEFIHFIFIERKKSEGLNWCFTNIKRVKIFLQIFHANQSGREIYKEEIAKNLTEYSYKTIAKIIDDGIVKKYFILMPPEELVVKDAKVKNIRPSEELITDFLNLSIEIISYLEKVRAK